MPRTIIYDKPHRGRPRVHPQPKTAAQLLAEFREVETALAEHLAKIRSVIETLETKA